MGASFDSVTAYGKTAEEAMDSAIEDRNYEYGCRAYCGHLGHFEGAGLEMVTSEVLTFEDADKLMEYHSNRDEYGTKFGALACIEIKSDKKKKRKFLFFGWCAD
tara:strand:- start:1857 stop:2168 length:312 start_codon:yes stop_codon:yes gene_type:complete